MATASPWPQKISAFALSPSQFLSSTTSECFLAELLCELRDDKASESIKILLLSLLQEYPNVLCPSTTEGEETVLELLAVFNQAPPRSVNLKCHLMLAITNVLVCASRLDDRGDAAAAYVLDLLLQTVQDTNDVKDGQASRPLRALACDCLREVETCFPGLFSQKLEALYLLKQQEMTPLHQAYCVLYALSLKNAIHLLSRGNGAPGRELKSLLAGNEGLAWKAVEKPLPPVSVSSMGQIPMLQTNTDVKELRSIVSFLLEESYLLTPVSQAALLRELVEVVVMVQALSPAIFKSQLLRLCGTAEVTLMHATLLMKAAFTDSLFTTEDENFFIKRLVGMAQHPLLGSPQKLFYMDCILHFPENRPISSNGEESLPVLVTPRLAASLLPTVFNNSSTMLCRLRLLSLVYMEADDDDDDKGVSYLFDHLMALHRIVDNHGTREMTVTFFRAAFTFLGYFYHSEKFTSALTARLTELYSRHCYLAPNLMNLVDHTQEYLGDSGWSIQLLKALQKLIVELPIPELTLQNLSWHLKVLGRVAIESQVPQRNTLCFLLSVLINSSLCSTGGWRLGNAVLAVCRNLLLHPSLDQVFIELADLLQHTMLRYEDADIRDHARFYYTLLTNLSREKLSGVLTKGPDVGPTKVRSLSSVMAESDEQSSCLTVHQTREPVLQLLKVPQSESWEAPGEGESESVEDEEVLTAYREQFLSPGFASEVNLKCHLKHMGEANACYHKLFSICLHFELTDANYEEVNDITVPCVFKDRKPPVVRLKLKPRQPYPTRLRTSAMFTTEDGLSWYTQLQDVFVSFPDVFLPLPVTADWSRESREQLFDHIWTGMCSEESGHSATSLFCFELGDRSLSGLVDENFHPYLISGNPKQECYKVLFFLPPQCHVLLNITDTEDAVHVRIATDNWKLLPYINAYLQNVTSETQMNAESLVQEPAAGTENASREM